jgi:cytidylate kinase
LPNANVKIFLTATVEDRARRRWEELVLKDPNLDFQTVLKEVAERDRRDESRDAAPTRCADDAELIDTTGDTLEQSVDTLEKYVIKRLVELSVL